MDKVDNKKLAEIAKSYLVQKDQRQRTEQVLTTVSIELDKLEKLNTSNDDMLDQLMKQAKTLSV